MKYAAIENWADENEYPVVFMCRMLEVPRSGYYAWKSQPESDRALTDKRLRALVASFFERLNKPGVRRLHAELRVAGHKVSRKRVWRLMRELGVQGRHPRAWRRTTIAGAPANAPDLIGRDFTATGPGQRLVGDITYIKTWQGWAYLATVIDLYSRKLVGWSIADNMRT